MPIIRLNFSYWVIPCLSAIRWKESKISREASIQLSNFIRESKPVSRPKTTRIRPNDVLILTGNIEAHHEMGKSWGLEIMKNANHKDQERSHELKMVEILIPSNSTMISSTMSDISFFRRYKPSVIAIQRRGRTFKERLSDIKLESGDTLLLQGHDDDVQAIMNSKNMIVTNDLSSFYLRKTRAVMALVIMLTIIGLSIFNILPIMIAAIIGAAPVWC